MMPTRVCGGQSRSSPVRHRLCARARGRATISTAALSPKSVVSSIKSTLDDLHGRSAEQWRGLATATAFATALAVAPMPAGAADVAAVGSCLLQKCQVQLAGCLGDVTCLKSLACLQTCNGRPDEKACQIRCGDLYDDKAVATFNCCAVSDQKCVPQAFTEDYPLPKDEVLDDSFDLSQFQGRWYITAGYNKLFDTFDCQEHYFQSPEPGKLFGNIQWRIDKPDGDFLERSTVQRFVQVDPKHPGKLENHDNEYLHYEDDWYIASWKPDEYAFIYYKGNNDAWSGYGGATVYTRTSTLPPEIVPEMRRAAKSVGLEWDNFTITDNTCKPHPNAATGPFAWFSGLKKFEENLFREVEDDLVSFGRGFTVLESALEKEITAEGRTLQRELSQAGKELQKMEDNYGSFKLPKPLASVGTKAPPQ